MAVNEGLSSDAIQVIAEQWATTVTHIRLNDTGGVYARTTCSFSESGAGVVSLNASVVIDNIPPGTQLVSFSFENFNGIYNTLETFEFNPAPGALAETGRFTLNSGSWVVS